MRILSQEKLGLNYDIPYEQVCLNINKKSDNSFRIYAWHILSNSDDSCFLVAEYSTETKARKAMEMLRNEYHGYKVEETYHEGTEYYHPIFRFPSDDEVEV